MAYEHSALIQSMALISAVPYFPAQACEIMKQFSTHNKSDEEWKTMRQIHFNGNAQIEWLWQQTGRLGDNKEDMNFTPQMLSKIQEKTLIVQGDRDPLYLLELTIEMYKAIPNAYLWIIPNNGHVPIQHIQ